VRRHHRILALQAAAAHATIWPSVATAIEQVAARATPIAQAPTSMLQRPAARTD